MNTNTYQTMIDYLNYVFPNRKFSKEYLDILYAIFMKGCGEGELAGEIEANKYQSEREGK